MCTLSDDAAGTYELESTDGGAATMVKATVNVDPGGNFPMFAINAYGKTWPPKTLDTLEEHALKTFIESIKE